jgi:hypothetical protein
MAFNLSNLLPNERNRFCLSIDSDKRHFYDSNEDLMQIFAAYEQLTSKDIERTIQSNADIRLSRALMTIGK